MSNDMNNDNSPSQPVIRAGDVMDTAFDLVNGRDTVKEALEKMQHITAQLLVVDKRHADDEYGIVRFSDIANKVLAPNRSPERVNIYEIMTKPVISVPEHMNIRYCARFLQQSGIRRATVVNQKGEIVGILGYQHLIQHWVG